MMSNDLTGDQNTIPTPVTDEKVVNSAEGNEAAPQAEAATEAPQEGETPTEAPQGETQA